MYDTHGWSHYHPACTTGPPTHLLVVRPPQRSPNGQVVHRGRLRPGQALAQQVAHLGLERLKRLLACAGRVWGACAHVEASVCELAGPVAGDETWIGTHTRTQATGDPLGNPAGKVGGYPPLTPVLVKRGSRARKGLAMRSMICARQVGGLG